MNHAKLCMKSHYAVRNAYLYSWYLTSTECLSSLIFSLRFLNSYSLSLHPTEAVNSLFSIPALFPISFEILEFHLNRIEKHYFNSGGGKPDGRKEWHRITNTYLGAIGILN